MSAMDHSDTLGILKRLERGEISADQAAARLNAPPSDGTVVPQWVRSLWVYPLVAGILLVGSGAWIIIATVNANVLWFILGLPIVLLGAFVVAIAADAPSGHWVYINIKESGQRRHAIRFGVPFPFGLIRGGLWIAQCFAPYSGTRQMNPQGARFDWSDAGALLDALERELRERRGVSVDIDANDKRMQVFII